MVTVGMTVAVVEGGAGGVVEDVAEGSAAVVVEEVVEEVITVVVVVGSVAGAEQDAAARHPATRRVRALTSDTLPRSDGYT
jgi:hypothetical protein